MTNSLDFPAFRDKVWNSNQRVIFFLLLSLFLFQCSGEKEKRPKNMILITLDTHRADYVSAYDPEKAKTPNIDFFARKGMFVERMQAAGFDHVTDKFNVLPVPKQELDNNPNLSHY